MILLTDGVNNTGKISPVAAAEAAKALGVKIYTIAVGVRGEAPMPVKDDFGNTRLVMAKVDVDEKTLQTIAAKTGGAFYRATDTGSLQNIYGQINRLEKSAHTLKKYEHYQELYSWALIPALGRPWSRLRSAADTLAEIAVTFVQPLWLLAGFAACLGLIWMWRRYDAHQRATLVTFVAEHLRVQLTSSLSIGRRRVKRGLFLAAVALLFVALAGPQAGYQWEQVTRRGNDIMFAVDTSRSMLTPDVKPNRLARAKLAIEDFTDRLNGDAVGLVAFAGTAFLQVPLTTDYDAFRESCELRSIQTSFHAVARTSQARFARHRTRSISALAATRS